MKIPPKVRIFWWCAINSFLPTKAELKPRHVEEESHCEACGNPVEDRFHVAISCPQAKRFWQVLKKNPARPTYHSSWTPPEQGWVKVNTDASFLEASFSGGSGCVIRDSCGEVLAAEARWHNNVSDVLTMEALAARNGLLVAVAYGYRRVVLEIDNLSLVNELISSDESRSSIAGLWHEIRELGRSFISFKVFYVRRESNTVAHCCAAKVPCNGPFLSWISYTPDGQGS
ncbi:hypothetical protein BAE44_0004812 [Dichanthelium oligosanthes]|uniref:RNase H type-1 domain-containing protein n=1 Tax=Dichanthelium oligosanthes TaxID=888268 RepID=A0A1E5W9V9_9POAL|nr:hypothetical protein BAE44_0004812 [Dichanthelium oligosanthes]